MSFANWIGILTAVGLAVGGYAARYWHALAIRRREERLRLLSDQINNLYGPLYILTTVGKHLVDAQRRLSPFGFFKNESDKQPDELAKWENWYRSVAAPNNERLYAVVLGNAHLIREEVMPECLLQLIAHIASYKTLERCWENGDYSATTAPIGFPVDLAEYASDTYQSLKGEQVKLIRRLMRS